MGVEYYLIRKDNKTIFDCGETFTYNLLEFVYSPSELLEYIFINVYQRFTKNEGDSTVFCFIIRDRILNFVEGSKLKDLFIETDGGDFVLDNPDYKFIGDRYVSSEDKEKYGKMLDEVWSGKYQPNPLKYFEESGISMGCYHNERNNRM